MKRNRENEELIDLGPATAETKGLASGTDDHSVGLIKFEGLSDD
jgi:hypothetical protein